MRLIDAEAVEKYPIRRGNYDKENGNIDFINGVESVLEYVGNLPTIEIVRCKDCVYRKTEDCAMYYQSDYTEEQYSWECADDFCSWGRRKEE